MVFFAFTANTQINYVVNKSDKDDLNTTRISTSMKTGLRTGKVNYISETFDSEIPATWTIVNNGAGSGWLWTAGTPYISSDEAGMGVHEAAELKSPSVNASGATALTLAFDSYYNREYLDEVATVDVWDGSAWQTIIEYTEDHGSLAVMVHFEYDISAYAGADLQIRFNYDDSNHWCWNWYIDNVEVFENNDLGINSVTPIGHVLTGSTLTPAVTVENFGLLAQSTYDITLVSDPAGYDEIISNPGTIEPGATLTVDFPEWSPSDGNYTLTATVILLDDANPDNNIFISEIQVREYFFGEIVLEFFTEAVGCPGIETDGNNIYTAYYDPNTSGRHFDKYTMTGTFIEEFEISGVSAVKDLAYNTNTGFFYGADGNTSLFEMDFNTNILKKTIIIPTNCCGICYDDDDNTFWANSWSTDLIEFDISGAATGRAFTPPSIYGAAYDNWSDPSNPTIWGHTGTYPGDTPMLEEYSLNGTATGRTIDCSTAQGYVNGLAGGLASFEADGRVYLLANIQQEPKNIIVIYYLCSIEPTYTVTFTVDNGTAPLQDATIDINGEQITTNASGIATIDLENGIYSYTVTLINYNNANGEVVVDDAVVNEHVTLTPLSVNDLDSNISIYPNPSSGVFNIKVDNTYKLKIMDITGKVIYNEQLNNSVNNIDISNNEPGTYIINLSTKDKSINYKVIIE